MEESDESQNEITAHLHPNWMALASVKFRRKIFVKSTEIEIQKNEEKIYEIEVQDSSNFYQEVLQMPSTSLETSSKPIKKHPVKKNAKKEKVEFSKEVLFRLALSDDGDEIQKYFNESINPDINATDNFGWTALMMASCEGTCESFQTLLDLGAELNISDRTGNTARTLAYQNKRDDILNLIDTHNNSQECIEISESEDEQPQSSFCPDCKINITSASSKSHHTSTVHLINCKFKGDTDVKTFGIAKSNKGFKIMKTLGWDGNSALGSKKDGKLYPIKTVLRKGRSGLGIAQDSARVTHFKPYDVQAIKFKSGPPRALKRKEIERNAAKDKKREQLLRRELS
jgi:hypothetical protein